MITLYELEKIRLAIKEGRSEEYLEVLETKIKEEHVCTVVWCVDDVATLMQGSTKEQIKEVAKKSAKTLSDRSTEEGWQILDDLVDFHTN